ncbi:MAG: hydrogenase expression/formation C-terminal domain-containing protein [Pseudomonadota bacterium]
MKDLGIPVVVEPGSQPADEDGVVIDYMKMPQSVWTYDVPVVPEPEDVVGLDEGLKALTLIRDSLSRYEPGTSAVSIPLDHLDPKNRTLIDQVLGNGEVSIVFDGPVSARIQESVLTGVWRVQYVDDDDQIIEDVVEVASVPKLIERAVFTNAAENISFEVDGIPAEVGNAPAIMTEIQDKLAEYAKSGAVHVVNLTLLPCSDADLDFMATMLGSGPAVILSRGYGNCRITSTGTRNLWWVQFFNSQDTLILNSLEVSAVPEVACAAPEDLADSAERLDDILELYQ